MKAKITDKETINRLSSLDVTNWLRASGWRYESTFYGRFALFNRTINGDTFEVEVPVRNDLRDFALRMAEVLETVSAVEDRSELEILKDIRQTQVDTLRTRLKGVSITNGRIPMEKGVQMYGQVRELLLAGACASVEKRPVFAKRKPEQAMNYLRTVTLAPSEEGSFVAVIESPVTPKLQLNLLGVDDDPPFERRVMRTLAVSLKAVHDALGIASVTGDSQPFFDVVPRGVTANLCDALAGILRSVEIQSLDLQFSWSRNRPVPTDIDPFIHFTPEVAPLLESASNEFRIREPLPDFELIGPIIELASSDSSKGGRITVGGYVDGRAAKIRVELDQTTYHQAIQAHEKKQIILLEGELCREGRTYVLNNSRNFAIETDE